MGITNRYATWLSHARTRSVADAKLVQPAKAHAMRVAKVADSGHSLPTFPRTPPSPRALMLV